MSPMPEPHLPMTPAVRRAGSRYSPLVAQRRFHYEQAFEHYLRANAIPYVAVNEAKRALAVRPGRRAAAVSG